MPGAVYLYAVAAQSIVLPLETAGIMVRHKRAWVEILTMEGLCPLWRFGIHGAVHGNHCGQNNFRDPKCMPGRAMHALLSRPRGGVYLSMPILSSHGHSWYCWLSLTSQCCKREHKVSAGSRTVPYFEGCTMAPTRDTNRELNYDRRENMHGCTSVLGGVLNCWISSYY